MSRMLDMTPLAPVTDVRAGVKWFETCLGFTATPAGDTMVHPVRDAANIRLVLKSPGMDLTDPRHQQSLYINVDDVDDVDALYAGHKSAMEANGDDCAPFDRPYGMREIHIIYESLLIYFGQPIPREPV